MLTCTLGAEGEVIPPELRELEGHPDDLLAPHRLGELVLATERLGVTLHVLGADATGTRPRYRDSGMVGSAAAARPEAFAAADLDEAGREVADVILAVRPDVVVTYDPQGGYGHPDHIQTHRAARAALAQLADAELPGRTFQILTPHSWAVADRVWLREGHAAAYGLRVPGVNDPYPPSVVPDDQVTHVVEDPAARAVKNEALRGARPRSSSRARTCTPCRTWSRCARRPARASGGSIPRSWLPSRRGPSGWATSLLA